MGPGGPTGYGLAKHGRYPVKVLRLGNAYGVVTAGLLKPLGREQVEGSASRAA